MCAAWDVCPVCVAVPARDVTSCSQAALVDAPSLRCVSTDVLGLALEYAATRPLKVCLGACRVSWHQRMQGVRVRCDRAAYADFNRAAASASGEFFATDNDCVRVLAADGTLLRVLLEFGDAPGQIEAPSAIAVAPTGEVVVTDRLSRRVKVVRADGALVRMWSVGGKAYEALGLAVTSDGAVLVADHENHCVKVFRLADGAFVRRFGSEGAQDGQLRGPWCIAEAAGEVFVGDSEGVHVFTTGGVFLRRWAVSKPRNVTIRGHEVLVIADSCLLVFRADGTLVRAVALPGGARCVAVAPTGRVLVRAPVSVCEFE